MKITLLFHENDRTPHQVGYTLWPMVEAWRAAGHEVVEQYGVATPVQADLVFLHVDLTVIPDEVLAAVEACPRVINRGVRDISKTVVSRNRVLSPGEWDGPVIVKTVRNHGGNPERALEKHGFLRAIRDHFARRGQLPLAWADWLPVAEYPIFASARDVPKGVFANPALIVEKFRPERRGEHYCLRSYTFLGDRHHAELIWAPRPVVKRRHAVGWAEAEVPPELVQARQALGVDYAKFDYVEVDGEVILLDVNRTPSFGRNRERQVLQGERLAPGIDHYFR
jgi:hypothetical protein